MKQYLFALLLPILAFAELYQQYPSQKLLDQKTPIVDIRTPPEWVETGLIQGAIPIMFYNEKGGYDLKGFMRELNEKVDTSKPFALICRTGSRTAVVSKYLAQTYGYDVINVVGGMVYTKALKLKIEPYKP
jgi:rhodanese-related sulfurtransferase